MPVVSEAPQARMTRREFKKRLPLHPAIPYHLYLVLFVSILIELFVVLAFTVSREGFLLWCGFLGVLILGYFISRMVMREKWAQHAERIYKERNQTEEVDYAWILGVIHDLINNGGADD